MSLWVSNSSSYLVAIMYFQILHKSHCSHWFIALLLIYTHKPQSNQLQLFNNDITYIFGFILKGDQGISFRVMVFNATFNNISVIAWRSVLLVEDTGVPGENHRPAASHWQTLSHNVVLYTPRLSEIRTHNVSGDRC